MTFDQLQVVEAIVSEGGFRAAALKLHRAQSAITYAVKQLEDEFGVLIFSRDQYRAQLTDAGRSLINRMSRLNSDVRALGRFMTALGGGVEPKVRLGVSPISDFDLVSRALHELAQRFPDTSVEVVIDVLSGQDLLIDGVVDLAIVEIDTPPSRFLAAPLSRVSMPIVASPDLVGNLDSDADLTAALLKFPQIVVRSHAGGAMSRTSGIVAEARTWGVTDFFSKKSLILHGLGWGRLPRALIEKELSSGRLRCIESDRLHHVQVCLHLMQDSERPLGPVGQHLWQLIVERMGDVSPRD